MRAKVRLPKTRLGWLFLFLFIIDVMFGTWPFVPFFNQNKIVLGVPLLMLWVYIVVFTTTFLMWLSSKMGVK